MHLNVQQQRLYAYTGGKVFAPEKPTAVFIHGVLNDHSVWVLQTRYFAHHGWNVLAIDLPGQGRSTGQAPDSVEAASQTVLALLDELAINQAALIGHSLGALIALEAAHRAPQRISHLALVGFAYPMRVTPYLLDTSLTAPLAAIDAVNVFSHATLAPPPSALGPGTWLHGASRALMRRMLHSNPDANVFHTGFKACDGYANGENALKSLVCPVRFVLGEADQMTPLRTALATTKLVPQASVVTLAAGHSLMTECPDGVLQALVDFLPAS